MKKEISLDRNNQVYYDPERNDFYIILGWRDMGNWDEATRYYLNIEINKK